MTTSQWVPVVIDRRGSMTLPADMKRTHGFAEGTVFMGRALDGIAVLVPLDRFLSATPQPVTDHQKDATMAMAVTAALHGQHTVQVPLFPAQAPAPEASWRESEAAPVDGNQQLVYMNKKGFIPTPDSVKEALNLQVGDSFTVEIRNADGRPVIQLEPLHSKGALEAYTARSRQQHEQEAAQAVQIQRGEARLAELREQIEALSRTREMLDSEVRKKRAASQGTNLFAQLLNGPEKTIAPAAGDGNPLPDQMNPHSPPTETLPPGTKWNFGSVGWVKVADIDYVAPEEPTGGGK